jgi:hypothetical protein
MQVLEKKMTWLGVRSKIGYSDSKPREFRLFEAGNEESAETTFQ